jgi:hypothetical protein
MDQGNGEEQVKSRSMNQKPCDDMKWIISFDMVGACVASTLQDRDEMEMRKAKV